jgi:hypothetical protein
MLEVSGADIGKLTDSDLRTVVARLALAEMRAQGAPLSAVTAGGNQDAPDGGLDVRVECPTAIPTADFIPRRATGFQVKKPDMPAAEITKEMRPAGVLRPAIVSLADASGAYIIVSAQGSVADKPLVERRKAIRDALHDLPTAEQLHTDFYDRDRLATWASEYPGIAAWVKERVGRGTAGWSSIGLWSDAGVSEAAPYLFNDKACLIDERSRQREALTIGEGIARLRAAMRTPKQCIRLIGLSGLGKTRLVQALFENSVGEEALDPGLAIYADYSTETDPTARDMARQLVALGQRAILIVDNCNPTTHAELARICSESASNVSLLTVEYDVRDDEPERTEVFRLESAAPGLVAQWLEGQFPDISQIDRDKIAEFSDGNFRVARAVAETLERGETLGKLKSRELFERIFHQRNQHDQSLFAAAEELALLYSVDGEDTGAEGELAIIGAIRGVGASQLYGALVELGRRGLAQTRGRWRAILPHAIANPLASFALERMPAADFDRFAASLTPRMLKSLSRRLGYLHDDRQAQTAVVRWLRADGPLGDLFALGETGIQIIANLAPVAPEVVLAKLECELDGQTGQDLLGSGSKDRWQWIRLIKMLAYEAHMFEQAAMLLARFVAAEQPDNNNNSASGPFGELFQLYLSGTQATPAQRRGVIERLARSGDAGFRRAAIVGLDSLLGARQFTATSSFDFGARSRDWGWRPKTNGDVWSWYDHAIALAVYLSLIVDDARATLASSIRELWFYAACHEALDRAATALVKCKPWIEGWLAFRATLKYDGKAMDPDVKASLEAIIHRLKPSDLLHQARAVVLNRASGGWDVADCEPDDGDVMRPWHKASQLAQEVGRSLAKDIETRREFIGELLAERHPSRAFECGRGLAEGASELGPLWQELVARFAGADPKVRNATILGGFIRQAHDRDPDFMRTALDAAIQNPALAPNLPYLQGCIAIDEEGIARLRRAIALGMLQAGSFYSIANGVVGDAPPVALGRLLMDIAALTDGVEIALDILHMHFYRDREDGRPPDLELVDVGRDLLGRTDFGKKGTLRDYGLHTVIRVCCSGTEGEAAARMICQRIRTEMETAFLSTHDLGHVLKALFETQPFIALDIFLLPGPALKNRGIFEMDLGFGTPVEGMDPAILRQWADRDAAQRYPLLGQSIAMFKRAHGEEENKVAPLFLETLGHAPDKRAFLGDFWTRLHPRSWSGSLADILFRRRAQVIKLSENPDPEIRGWVADMLPEIDRWIEHERGRDRAGEESFE